ncbi:MAG: ribonuclease E/G, partial [Lentisphaeria bacterium]|nr:ribonuclease E/G [Lentisphaeria bacterium]
MKQILINSEELQVRVAVVEDGTLQDFFMERTNKDRIVGSIYKGKIKNLEPSLQAAFVDIGVGKNAFLHYWDMLPATLEKLEGDGDDYDDDELTKPGQERAHAAMENSMDEDDSFDPPSPPEIEHAEAVDESDVIDVETQATEESVKAPETQEAAPEEVAEAPAVVPEVVMDGKVIPPDTQLAEGLLPISKNGISGLIPLAKSAAPADAKTETITALPKLEPLTKPVTTSETENAPAEQEPPKPVVEQITIDENPPPVPAEMAPRQNANQNGNNRNRNQNQPQNQDNRQRPQNQKNNNSNGQQSNGNSNVGQNSDGGHRSRRRRNRGNRDNAGAQNGQRNRKPGIFRRVLEMLFPALKRSRLEKNEQQPANKQPQQTLTPLSPNSGKGELVPLTPNGKTGTVKPQQSQPQPPKMEKLPKPEKPKKPEKKGPTVEDIPNLFHVDQEILVQVTKGPIGTKGARVTTNISIPGRYLVLLPGCPHVGISRRVEDREERSRLKQMIKTILPPNMGVICRTEGAGLKREHFLRDLQMLMDAWHKAEDISTKRRAPVCVYQEPALVERTLRDSLTQDIDEIVCDTKEAYDLAVEMLRRFDRLDSIKVKLYNNPAPIFIKYGISQQIEGISNPKVPLPSGG